MAALPAATASVHAPAPTSAMLRGAINRRMSIVGMFQRGFKAIWRDSGPNESRAAGDNLRAFNFAVTASGKVAPAGVAPWRTCISIISTDAAGLGSRLQTKVQPA